MSCYRRNPAQLLLTLLSLIFGSARAQEVAEIPLFSAPVGTTALGGGLRGGQSPYLPSDNEDVRQRDLIPLYLYEGKYLFFRGISGGIHVINRDDVEISLFGRYRFQKLDPGRNIFYQGINEREQSFDAGVRIAYANRLGRFNVSWVTDTLNRHNGQEIQAAYRYELEAGPWTFSPFISWSWQDDNLTNYYFIWFNFRSIHFPSSISHSRNC